MRKFFFEPCLSLFDVLAVSGVIALRGFGILGDVPSLIVLIILLVISSHYEHKS